MSQKCSMIFEKKLKVYVHVLPYIKHISIKAKSVETSTITSDSYLPPGIRNFDILASRFNILNWQLWFSFWSKKSNNFFKMIVNIFFLIIYFIFLIPSAKK